MPNKTELKRIGLKTTQPRLKILEGNPTRHLGTDSIYKRLFEEGEQSGPATAYRVLAQFESAGLVMRHNFEGGSALFELNDADHHDHMFCVKCKGDFEFMDSGIEQLQCDAESKNGFVMRDHSLYLYGICPGMMTHGGYSMKKNSVSRG